MLVFCRILLTILSPVAFPTIDLRTHGKLTLGRPALLCIRASFQLRSILQIHNREQLLNTERNATISWMSSIKLLLPASGGGWREGATTKSRIFTSLATFAWPPERLYDLVTIFEVVFLELYRQPPRITHRPKRKG